MEEDAGQGRSEGGMGGAGSNYSARPIAYPLELVNMGQRIVTLARLLIYRGAFQRGSGLDLGEEDELCRFTIGLESDKILTAKEVEYVGRVLREWMNCYRVMGEFAYFASDSLASERLGRTAIPDVGCWLSYEEYPNSARFAHDPPAYCPSESLVLLIVEAVRSDTQHIFKVIDQLRLNNMVVNKVVALVDLSDGILSRQFDERGCQLRAMLTRTDLMRVGRWYGDVGRHQPLSCS